MSKAGAPFILFVVRKINSTLFCVRAILLSQCIPEHLFDDDSRPRCISPPSLVKRPVSVPVALFAGTCPVLSCCSRCRQPRRQQLREQQQQQRRTSAHGAPYMDDGTGGRNKSRSLDNLLDDVSSACGWSPASATRPSLRLLNVFTELIQHSWSAITFP